CARDRFYDYDGDYW
nr:immunoglobulin heavy chain junction region [Mus musculus]